MSDNPERAIVASNGSFSFVVDSVGPAMDRLWAEGLLNTNLDLSPDEPGIWMFEGGYEKSYDHDPSDEAYDPDDYEDRFVGTWRELTDAEGAALTMRVCPWGSSPHRNQTEAA